jgi:hypothetical protein
MARSAAVCHILAKHKPSWRRSKSRQMRQQLSGVATRSFFDFLANERPRFRRRVPVSCGLAFATCSRAGFGSFYNSFRTFVINPAGQFTWHNRCKWLRPIGLRHCVADLCRNQ